jgi:hypothetical protein
MNSTSRVFICCLLVSACAKPMALVQAPQPVNNAIRGDSAAGVHVQLDSAHDQVVLRVSGIRLQGGMAYGHEHVQTNVAFVWPARGWARGYRVDVLDSSGRLLPQKMLHHAGVVNLDRRQLPYPMAERLVAAAHETPPVMLPGSMGVPLAPDQHMMLYYMLVNPADSAIDGVTLRVSIAWTPERSHGPRDVYPLYLDANPAIGRYDLPPGVSTTSTEFTLPVGGRVRAMGGHAHDYAVELRLEDAVTNTVLVRLTTKRDAEGHIESLSTDRFVFTWGGLHLDADRRYRVVGVYDNPTCATIPRGGMAFLAGPFAPDDMSRWPVVDRNNPLFQQDYADLVAPADDMAQGDDMAGMENMAGMGDAANRAHRPGGSRCSGEE